MEPVDLILLLILALLLFSALKSLFRRKKNGGCACGCAGCPSSEKCSHAGALPPFNKKTS